MESTIAQPDVTLQLDLSGVITAATLGGEAAGSELGWVGRRWADTVSDLSRAMVVKMLDEARDRGVSAFVSLQQRFGQGSERSVEYTTVRLGGDGGLLAIGRSHEVVAALSSRLVSDQRSMERQHWRQQHVATRYQLLFETSHEPELTLSPSLDVVEVNPAATALGLTAGAPVLSLVAPEDREAFEALLRAVERDGSAPAVPLHLARAPGVWSARVSSVLGDPAAGFAMHLAATAPKPAPAPAGRVPFESLIAELPEALVVVDERGELYTANRAFAELLDVSSPKALAGQALGRWLTIGGVSGPLSCGQLAALPPRTVGLLRREDAHVAVAVSLALTGEPGARWAAVQLRELNPAPLRRSPELDALVQRQVGAIERAVVEASRRAAAKAAPQGSHSPKKGSSPSNTPSEKDDE